VTKKRSIRKTTLLRKTRTGLENPKKADLKPLKRLIRAHIKRLSSVKDPTSKVQSALQSLKQVQRNLSRDCLPTMVLDT
jgi:hypothetical protein